MLTAALSKPVDLLVVAACWFGMYHDRYSAEQRSEFAVTLDTQQRSALDGLRQQGCPLLAMHTAPICFDGWEPWHRWLGGTWDWATSWHPEPAALDLLPASDSPLAAEPFQVVDEEYQELIVDASAQLVASSERGHPLVWINESELGRSAVNLLGHDRRSLGNPAHQSLNNTLLDWLIQGSPS